MPNDEATTSGVVAEPHFFNEATTRPRGQKTASGLEKRVRNKWHRH
jgi:hypothetical protein